MRYSRLLSMVAAMTITATGLILVAPPAFGEPPMVVVAPSDVITRHINYADLNLASAEGEATLNGRVSSTVGSLCDEAVGANDRSLRSTIAMKQCVTVAWYQARPQISQAVLRAHDIASTGISAIAASAISIVISN